jgi:hypothetical protein
VAGLFLPTHSLLLRWLRRQIEMTSARAIAPRPCEYFFLKPDRLLGNLSGGPRETGNGGSVCPIVDRARKIVWGPRRLGAVRRRAIGVMAKTASDARVPSLAPFINGLTRSLKTAASKRPPVGGRFYSDQ